MKHARKIFINYRRGDSSGYAGRLYDRLIAEFGTESVFMDVDSIPAGSDFARILDEQVMRATVFLALMGRDWLQIDSDNHRRIDREDDFVRVEIESAIRHGVPVIPVLLDNLQMPPAGELPLTIRQLATLQSARVTHAHFGTDVDRLIRAIKDAGSIPLIPVRSKSAAFQLSMFGLVSGLVSQQLYPIQDAAGFPSALDRLFAFDIPLVAPGAAFGLAIFGGLWFWVGRSWRTILVIPIVIGCWIVAYDGAISVYGVQCDTNLKERTKDETDNQKWARRLATRACGSEKKGFQLILGGLVGGVVGGLLTVLSAALWSKALRSGFILLAVTCAGGLAGLLLFCDRTMGSSLLYVGWQMSVAGLIGYGLQRERML